MEDDKCSISDFEGYKSTCLAASKNDHLFSTFRTNATYNGILEHVSPEQGAAYAVSVFHNSPHLIQYLDRFKANDSVGGPMLHNYGELIGSISPTTLRYIKVLSDLSFTFGDLTGMKIVEIGAGYGGQCAIISKLFKFESYTIIDLPEPIELQKRYLKTLDVQNVEFIASTDAIWQLQSDLVISNYALSELNKSLADTYLRNFIYTANRGYLTCNHIDHSCYSKEEMIIKIPWAVPVTENPLTHPDNYILIWKSPNCSFKRDHCRLQPQIFRNS